MKSEITSFKACITTKDSSYFYQSSDSYIPKDMISNVRNLEQGDIISIFGIHGQTISNSDTIPTHFNSIVIPVS